MPDHDDNVEVLQGPKLVAQMATEDSKPSDMTEFFIEAGEGFPPFLLVVFDDPFSTNYRITFQNLQANQQLILAADLKIRAEAAKVQMISAGMQRNMASHVLRPGDLRTPPGMG